MPDLVLPPELPISHRDTPLGRGYRFILTYDYALIIAAAIGLAVAFPSSTVCALLVVFGRLSRLIYARLGRTPMVLFQLAYLIVWMQAHSVMQKRLAHQVAQIEAMSTQALHHVLRDHRRVPPAEVLSALCENPNLSEEDLRFVAEIDDAQLYERMYGSAEVLGKNKKGLAVMRLVAYHPNVTTDILMRISHTENEFVLGSIAESSKVPESFLREMAPRAQRDITTIGRGLALNRKTPPDILQDLAVSPSYAGEYTRKWARENLAARGIALRNTDTGCADNTREALRDVDLFADIAGCEAKWRQGPLDAPARGGPCGENNLCLTAAAACGAGWHLCGARGDGPAEIRRLLTAKQCAKAALGQFIAAVPYDAHSGPCANEPGSSPVCCGEDCATSPLGDGVWPQQTPRVASGPHSDTCAGFEPRGDTQFGVLCCRDKAR